MCWPMHPKLQGTMANGAKSALSFACRRSFPSCMSKPVPGITHLRNRTVRGIGQSDRVDHRWRMAEVELSLKVYRYPTRCTVSIENAGRHTAMYSAPPSSGVE